MSRTGSGKPLDRSCFGAVPFLVCRFAAAFLVVMIATGLRGASGQETLRWKFRDGDVLKYTMEQTTLMTVKVMGKERKQKRAVTTTYTWSVKDVAASGAADVIQRIERFTMKVDAPPFLPMNYDSSSPNNSVPEPFEPMVRQLKAVVGAEFSFKMKPTGEIADIQIPETTLKKLREGLPDEKSERDAFSEQALKEMMTQSSPPPFPQGPLEAGQSWSSKPSRVRVPPIGTL